MVNYNKRSYTKKFLFGAMAVMLAAEANSSRAQFETLARRDNASMMQLVQPIVDKISG